MVFGKPMVCMRVAFHETTEITKTTMTTQTATNKELSAGLAEIAETTKSTGIWGRVPQTTGLEIPENP